MIKFKASTFFIYAVIFFAAVSGAQAGIICEWQTSLPGERNVSRVELGTNVSYMLERANLTMQDLRDMLKNDGEIKPAISTVIGYAAEYRYAMVARDSRDREFTITFSEKNSDTILVHLVMQRTDLAGQALSLSQGVQSANEHDEIKKENEQIADRLEELKLMPKIALALMEMKKKYRRGYIIRGVPEDEAEDILTHSRKVYWAALLYSASVKGLNRYRMALMAFFHDLAEYKYPDWVPGEIDPDEKHRLERKAITELVADLGEDGQFILGLWEEYNAKQTPEAKIVAQLDKLEVVVQALVYEGKGYNTMSDFYPNARTKLFNQMFIRIFEILMRREHPLQNSYQLYYALLSAGN